MNLLIMVDLVSGSYILVFLSPGLSGFFVVESTIEQEVIDTIDRLQ